MKEFSTRQRLEEFKRKLAESKQGSTTTDRDNPVKTTSFTREHVQSNRTSDTVSKVTSADGSRSKNRYAGERKVSFQNSDHTVWTAEKRNNASKQDRVLSNTHPTKLAVSHSAENHSERNGLLKSHAEKHSPRTKYYASKTVTKAEPKSRKTFQERIVSDRNRNGNGNVEHILHKYTSHDLQQKERIRERTARVDEILAKYRNNSQYIVSSGAPNKVKSSQGGKPERLPPRAQTAEALPNGRSARNHMDVHVPRSAMAFRSRQLSSYEPEVSQGKNSSGPREEHETKTTLTNGISEDGKHQSKFQATLDSMLQQKHGHTGKRTDAWSYSAKDIATEKVRIALNSGQSDALTTIRFTLIVYSRPTCILYIMF